VKKPSVLDSFALIAFLGRERGFEKVRALLHDVQASDSSLLMNEINVGEVYYLTAKERSLDTAERFLHVLETLPIQVVANTFPQVLDAARLKAQFPVSYADAFAVATAIRANATLVTGDPEFRSVSHLVEIHWV
jgi:predicted nucleic acid-binding protein